MTFVAYENNLQQWLVSKLQNFGDKKDARKFGVFLKIHFSA